MKLKRNLLSVALVSAIMAISNQAAAQATVSSDDPLDKLQSGDQTSGDTNRDDDDAKELDGVQVVGIRAGIESAIERKRESTSVVEVVSAEDLGKLPDISIADSIARLPGLTAQRVAGRSSTISIRGLAGDYSTTLMNGREQVSVGDNRTVEFDQFPS
ncbi:MAG: TonB-dependent receptor plug domain-containing protein, partial [Xanthomonadales bacterium]|nr:TonB-dependent receptor plug domain-containing protein [Xanthomonadales bacterium]